MSSKSEKTLRVLFSIFLIIALMLLIWLPIRLMMYRQDRARLDTAIDAERDFLSLYKCIEKNSEDLQNFMNEQKIVSFAIYDSDFNCTYLKDDSGLFEKKFEKLTKKVDNARLPIIRKMKKGRGNNQIFLFNRLHMIKDEHKAFFAIIKDDEKEYFLRNAKINFAMNFMIIVVLLFYGIVAFLYLRFAKQKRLIARNQTMISLGNASAQLSHEIKNPLASIMLQTKLIKKFHPQALPEITIIDEECQRISSLLSEIRMFINSPEGEREDVDLNAFIKDECARYPDKNLKLKIDEKSKIFVNFNQTRFKSVINNVIQNAIDATQDLTSPEIEVSTRVLKSKEKVEIDIADNGKGIGKNADKAFDMYFSTKNSGIGFGLALAKRFTEAIGGKISLENRKQCGTICRIILPISRILEA